MASKYDRVYMRHIFGIKSMVQDIGGETDTVIHFEDLHTVGARSSYKGYTVFTGSEISKGNAAHTVALIRFIAIAVEALRPELQETTLVLFMNKVGDAILITKEEADRRGEAKKQVSDEEIRAALVTTRALAVIAL